MPDKSEMETQQDVEQREWENPLNWSCGIYRSARDPRIWVPKHNPRLGLTLNFAHRAAWWNLLGLATVPLGMGLLFLLLYLFYKR